MAAENAPLVVTVKADTKDLDRGLSAAVRAANREVEALKRQIASMSSDAPARAARGMKQVGDAARNADREVSKLQRDMRSGAGGLGGGAGGGLGGMLTQLRGLGGFSLGGLGVAAAAEEFVKLSDASTRITNALKVAGLEGQNLADTYKHLADVARANGADFESLATLFARVTISSKELGLTQAQVTQFVERMAQGLRASGTSSEQASDGIRQLTQALASGVLRGDEFNSVMENLPVVAQAIARGLGVTTGELRKMSTAGKLDAKTVFDAFIKGSADFEDQAGKTAVTFSQAFANINTSLIEAAGSFNELTGASGKAVEVLNFVATAIGGVAAAAEKASKNPYLQKLFSTLTDAVIEGPTIAIKNAVSPGEVAATPYDNLKKASEEFAKAHQQAMHEVGSELTTVKQQVTNLIVEFSRTASGADVSALTSSFDDLQQHIADGTVSATDFDLAILELQHAGADLEIIQTVEDAKDMFLKADKTAQDFQKTLADDLAKAVQDLGADFLAALGPDLITTIGKIPPALQQVLALFAALTGQTGQFINLLKGLPGAIGATDAAASTDATNFIKKQESFRSSAYYDVNAFRVGYGSDTYVDEMGKVQKVTKDTVVTVAQADQDLKRRIGEFQNTIVAAIGPQMWDSLDEGQKTALSSIAYNYGSLPKSIVAAIKQGDRGEVQRAIAALGTDNAGVNMARRRREADLYGKGGATGGEALGVQDVTDAQQKSNEADAAAAKIKGELGTAIDAKVAKQQEELKFDELYREAKEKAAADDRQLTDDEIANLHKVAHEYGQTQGQIAAAKAATTGNKEVDDRIQALKDETAQLQASVGANVNLTSAMDQEKVAREADVEVLQVENDLRAQGITITKEQDAAIRSAAQAHATAKIAADEYTKSQQDNSAAMKEFAGQIGQIAQSAIGGFIQDLRNGVSAGDAFKNMLGRVVDGLINMALQAAFSQKSMEALFGLGGTAAAGSGGGGILATILGLKKGGVVGRDGEPMLVNPRVFKGAKSMARGGVVPGGGIPIIAHPGELVVPRNIVAKGAAGRGGTVVNHINPSTGPISIDMSGTGLVTSSSENGKLLGQQIEAAVQVILVKESRPGGILRKQPRAR